ncbi:protein NRT1/ PTR FAMILY 8.5-like [Triticum urartu]|uniref:Peptide transporter PTR2 n=1 Tax=Triticum urartu TaxID=4572 RepID=A0A8R7P8X0_TRIUA|nr:protein NRT1/ PTR FAMILY 8.5-like [Triticum urartu]
MEAAGDEERPLLHHLSPELHQDGDSRYTNDGTVDVNGQPAVKASTGNWRACFFLLGVQFSECLAFFAISKNLVTYLTSVLHESNIDAARNVSTWFGTTFFTPLIGAFLADTYWGRYKTLVVFLSVYIVGMLVLTVSTTLPWMMQSSNHGEIHRITVYVGLYLTALGNGGIKPCTSPFGADQFDITDTTERVKKGSFFNWFYFLNTIGSLLSTTVIIWVQDNVGWGIGFAIPMILTSLSFMVFIASRRMYRYKSKGESPMTTASQVVVAAARNRHLKLPEDCTTLHYPPSSPSEATFSVQHTTQFRFLDKAAIVSPSTQEKKGVATSPWRLCTLSHVEEVKMLLRLCPAWASLLVFFMITAQMSSTVIEQGMAMDNCVGSFAVPPASLASFNVVTTLVLIPIYDVVLVPLARRATGEDRGLTQPQRLGVGLTLSTLAMAYLALLERNRLAKAAIGEAVSIMWQAPAYAVMGVSEVFTVIGMIELFYDRAPDNMRSLCTAFGQLAIAAGSYLNSAALGVVASATMWIPEDLDNGHLDYFFWTIAVLSALNLLQFVLYSMMYNDNVACRQRHRY